MLAIRLLSVLALALVAFAHKPVEAAGPLAFYTLPDGSAPVLCLGGHDGGSKHKHGGYCDACRISASALCPAPAFSTGAAPLIAIAVVAPTRPALRRAVYPPAAPPQAPPFA